MDEATALKLIEALAGGAQPFTGELLAADHLCQHPEIIRALCLAVRSLEERRVRSQRQRNLPSNVGKPWTQEESARLLDAFQAGKSFGEIAKELQRTSTGVQARLERMGLVAPMTHRWSTTDAGR